jgi:hypothetical protein
MVVVRVRGDESDFLTFRIGSNFSHPVAVPAKALLGCYGSSATLVSMQIGAGDYPFVYHDSCTSAGCTHTSWKKNALDRGQQELKALEPARIAAVDVAGKLVVVWSAGERGGLRMRMGVPDAFERGQDVLVFDDHVRGGKVIAESTLLGFRLFSREEFAVLLVSTVAGLHALRIGADGTVAPWPTRRVQ